MELATLHWPAWLSWANVWPVLSGVPGWIALGLALKKHRRERTLLNFIVKATHVEADEDEQSRTFFDGKPTVPAVWVTITNTGQKPVTVFEVCCKWTGVTREGKEFVAKSRYSVSQKLAEGDHCAASPHVGAKAKSIVAVWAADSTGKLWNVPSRLVDELNATVENVWR